MSQFLSRLIIRANVNDNNGDLAAANSTIEESVASVWSNPSDILSLLLIVGGDVIQKGIAQQAGNQYLPTPVVFSFGWTAYAFSALLATVGDNLLMPNSPDCPCIVLNTESHQTRDNHSWILGRIVRDFDEWQPKEVKDALEQMVRLAREKRPAIVRAGLCVSVFEADGNKVAGVQDRDIYFWSGYVVALIQLTIAAIAWGVRGNWITFVVVAAGTVLAFTSSSLRQWRHERWSCRKKTKKICALTRGNGAQHVIVVEGAGHGLDLEDLAAWPERSRASIWTKLANGILLLCWIVLLLTVTGIRNDTWILLAIGGTGMLHTVVIAGAARNPGAFGVHLKFKRVFAAERVLEALRLTEENCPGVGVSLVPTFFPAGPRPGQSSTWYYEAKHKREQRIMEVPRLVHPTGRESRKVAEIMRYNESVEVSGQV